MKKQDLLKLEREYLMEYAKAYSIDLKSCYIVKLRTKSNRPKIRHDKEFVKLNDIRDLLIKAYENEGFYNVFARHHKGESLSKYVCKKHDINYIRIGHNILFCKKCNKKTTYYKVKKDD